MSAIANQVASPLAVGSALNRIERTFACRWICPDRRSVNGGEAGSPPIEVVAGQPHRWEGSMTAASGLRRS